MPLSVGHLHLYKDSGSPGALETYENGHETDLEMSPRFLGTTIFEEIYIRIQV